MKTTKLFLVLACFMVVHGVGWAADCSQVDQANKFCPFGDSGPQLIKVISARGTVTNEIRRPPMKQELADQLLAVKANAALSTEQKNAEIDKINEKQRRTSVGIWLPMMEPPPCVRTPSNEIDGNSSKIFRNVNDATKGKFEYVVKAGGEYYVFKDVKYEWTFEHRDSDNKVDGQEDRNNAPGTITLANWNPWLALLKTQDEARGGFITTFGQTGGGSLSEPKAYANHHTTTYDSGIQGATSVNESSVLQAVKLTVRYSRLKLVVDQNIKEINGEGYSGGADPYNGPINVTSTCKVEETASDTWELDKVVDNPLPPAYSVNTNPAKPPVGPMWPTGVGAGGSAYRLVYVEDYAEPLSELQYTKGSADEPSFKAVSGGSLDQNIVLKTESSNLDAEPGSPELQAKLKYYLGNGDIYKVDNPFFDPSSTDLNKGPYLYFFYMAGNKDFGPYACGVNRDRLDEWYVAGSQNKQSPYWKTQPADAARDYVQQKLSHAIDSKGIPDWHMGVVFAVLGSDGLGASAMQNTKSLNEAWTKRNFSTFPKFAELKQKYADLKVGNSPTAVAAGKAYASLAALETLITSGDDYAASKGLSTSFPSATSQPNTPPVAPQPARNWYRFALTGYDSSLGSFCVGPQELEKSNPAVYREEISSKASPDDPSQTVPIKIAYWTVHKERMIMPLCYCNSSIDSAVSDLFTSKTVLQVVQANCCGVMTEARPENTRDAVKIEDKDGAGNNGENGNTAFRTKPVPELTMSNGQTESTVSVPAQFELAATEELIVKDKAGFSTGNAGTYNSQKPFKGDFDFTKNEFIRKDLTTNQETPISFFDPGKPNDMLVREDERVEIRTGGYDNIDGLSNFRGLGKSSLKIDGPNGPETLEYVDESGAKQQQTEVVRAMDRTKATVDGKEILVNAYKFDPNIHLFHVFRDPGTYKVTYKVWEANDSPQASEMTFNIQVQDVKTQNRSIEDRNLRQNNQN